MIFDKVDVGRMTYVADSLIGANSCIEAGAQLWNWRPGNAPFHLDVDDESVQIPLSKFGAIIGDRVVIGVNSSIYPARRIGEGSFIAPGCVIDRDIPPYSDVRVKQELIITKRNADEIC